MAQENSFGNRTQKSDCELESLCVENEIPLGKEIIF